MCFIKANIKETFGDPQTSLAVKNFRLSLQTVFGEGESFRQGVYQTLKDPKFDLVTPRTLNSIKFENYENYPQELVMQ